MQCYESLRLLATELSEAGFHTLRVHYDGTGESVGSDDDPDRMPAWMASIRTAVSALEAEAGVDGVILLGVRFGGTLAALVSEDTSLAGLVLWEPCTKGALYLRELEILAAGAAGGPRSADDAEDAGALVATGHRMSAETVRTVRTIDFDRIAPTGRPPVLLIARGDRPAPTGLADHFAGLGCPTTLDTLPGHKEMMIYPERSRPPWAIIDRILEWAALRSVGPGPAGSPLGSTLVAAEVVHERVLRRAVSFGEGGRLFGVLSMPHPPVMPTRASVLMLTGGVVPRTAVNGMYKAAAERLARAGHTVLRIDISGIGESAPEPGRPRGDVYARGTLSDVEAALALLRAEAPTAPIHVLGLCSGAYWAFRAAASGAELGGLILINPLVLGDWDDPAQAEETLTNVQARAAVTDSSRWMKLVRGEVDVLGRLGDGARGLGHRVFRARARIGWALGKMPAGVPAQLQQMLKRGVAVQVVFSEQDRGRAVLAAELGRAADRLAEEGLGTRLFEGADHTFNDFHARRLFLDWLDGYLERL